MTVIVFSIGKLLLQKHCAETWKCVLDETGGIINFVKLRPRNTKLFKKRIGIVCGFSVGLILRRIEMVVELERFGSCG